MNSDSSFDTKAGRLALNFTNTVYERPGYDTPTPATPIELLKAPGDLLEWCSSVELLPNNEVAEISREWKGNLEIAQRTLKKIIALREEIFSTIYSLISERTIRAADLEILNSRIKQLPARRLIKEGRTFQLTWEADLDPFERMSSAIVQDVIELITSEDLSRLRVCGASDCGWIFLDKSTNGKRRWCNMADCGNREKQRKFNRTH